MTLPRTDVAFKLHLIRCPDGVVRYEVTDGTCLICGAICLRQNVNGRLRDDTSYRHCTNAGCLAREFVQLPGMLLSDLHEKLIADALDDVRQSRGEGP